METGALYGTSEFFRATCGNGLAAMNYAFPPTMEGVCSHKSQVTVNDSFSHAKSQPQTIGSIGRPDCGLEIIYFNARSIVPKLDELRLLCAESSPHVVCIVETWLDDSVFDNELTISNYCLVRLDEIDMVAVYCCTLGMTCHTMSFLWVLITLSCLESLCTMVTITVFVFVHFIAHLPPFILYCNSYLFFYRILAPLYTLILYLLVTLMLIY